MKVLCLAAALALAASPAVAQVLAQANANLAPGGIADGAKAGINDAEGTAPDGKPSPGGRQGEGQQAGSSGSKMVKQGDSGANPPTKAETPNKP